MTKDDCHSLQVTVTILDKCGEPIFARDYKLPALLGHPLEINEANLRLALQKAYWTLQQDAGKRIDIDSGNYNLNRF